MSLKAAEPPAPDSDRVLFISSYSYGWDTVQFQIEGIQAGIGQDVVLDYEFMDTKRVDDETSARQFYEGLSYRLSLVEPYDVIILGDDAALLFALKYRDQLFYGIPLIFQGVNNEELAIQAAKDPLIAGILEKLSFEENINFARRLFPDAKRVVGIFDDTITGQAERTSFYQNAALFPELTFSEINTSVLTSEGLKTALKNIPKDTILIYAIMTQDASGKTYTNREATRLISEYACMPAFRMVSGGIGEGLLGGNIVSMELSGKLAADIAMQILSGTDPASFDQVMDSPNIYCIDESVMKQFGLPLSLIPEGAVIINHTPTFWEQYSTILLPAFLIILCLSLISALMFVDNRKRRRLVTDLKRTQQQLRVSNEHDFLTGLENRSKFTADLAQYLEHGLPCGLVMLDIDNFKKINDTYGHTAGDAALRELGQRLNAIADDFLRPYRFAGDEFILILKTGDASMGKKSLSRCIAVFDKPILLAGKPHMVSGSFGVAFSPQDAASAEQLIICADNAMYYSKTHGKNMLSFYNALGDEN
ncbi:MAG: GGDEF domain-containing protein [Lachnospiraceae bacterium]|nr:GGDEF domain-containing protein [Lachnospiraceae bacterium]